jgi:hypothetical protein
MNIKEKACSNLIRNGDCWLPARQHLLPIFLLPHAQKQAEPLYIFIVEIVG